MNKPKYKYFIFFPAILMAFLINTSHVFAGTANDASSIVPYSGAYAYGSNLGYYGSQFKDQDIAQLAYNAGVRTIRVSLPDWLITGYGTDSRLDAFKAYQSMGMTDLTAFLGEPNTNGTDNRETQTFPGASERAKTFKGLYEPVWLDAGKTQINPANTYANYVYKTVKMYGSYVKFWEIVNEPDFTYSAHGWQDASADPKSWYNVNPEPNDLANLKAPIQYYVREMRVAYDVIKTLQPNSYVATGGIGYPSFLDALMRNTDNPVDGSVTAEYPLKAGAYFDVLSFHTYPMYELHKWDNSISGFIYSRHSDAAVDSHLKFQNDFKTVLSKYGYGSTYPGKQWIVTETDVPQTTAGSDWGESTYANNYILKAHILGQANGIMQTYKYGLGENSTSTDSFNKMGLYGDISASTTTIDNAPKTEQYKAIKTISSLLFGKKYDASKTSQLALPSSVRGAAFADGTGRYTYALWAKTTTDQSESISVNYTFPFTFSGTRNEWDYSATGQNTSVSNQTVTLTSSPSFFVETNSSTNPVYNPPVYTPPVYTPPNPTPTNPVFQTGIDYFNNQNNTRQNPPVRNYVQPNYTQPVYTQPIYVQPTYINPTYTQPTYIQPNYAQPPYIQQNYGMQNYNQPIYNQQNYVDPMYMQQNYNQQYNQNYNYTNNQQNRYYTQHEYNEPRYFQPTYMYPIENYNSPMYNPMPYSNYMNRYRR